ncbi:MAG: recombinase family protein [Chloroflexota bacterium]|nr:recombinase family protein [Chloroflexota bacterium]
MTATVVQGPGAIIAASYERVSTRVQGRFGFSLGAQHQSLEDFARSQGWVLPEHLRYRDGEDADASGASWDLPGLNCMLEAASRREFGILVVPDLDRFARSLVKGLVLEEQLRKLGVRVVYQRIPTDDTPEGQLLKHQLLSFAEFERAKTTLRTTMGRRAKARTGRVVGNGGTPPYGHRFVRETLDNGQQRVVGLEPDPLRAPVAVRIVRMARQASTWQIADALAAEGVPTPAGGRWTSKAVHRIATDPTHVGRWRFVDITVPVQPLLAESDNRTPTAAWLADWTAAQQALSDRVPGPRTRLADSGDPYLLRGLLSCGHCGSVLRAQPNRGARYYLCGRHAPSRARRLGKPACDLPDVPAADLEAEAWRVLTETLLDPDVLAAGLAAARSTRDELTAFGATDWRRWRPRLASSDARSMRS